MKISLINPNLSGDVFILDMAITYLATYINDRTNHNANIIDFTFHRKNWEKYMDRQIEKHQPDLIGITCCSVYMHYVKAMAKYIKEKFNLPIVVGAYHPSLDSDETLEIEEIDAICIGDGEYALEGYMDALEGKRAFKGIDGMWIKNNGDIIRNKIIPLIQNIDNLPIPNYDLLEDIDDYLFFTNSIYFIGNRGCPYNCSYCSELPMRQRIPGEHVRKRNPRLFVHEIKCQYERYKDRHMNIAHICDPAFGFDTGWLNDFMDEYKKVGLSTKLPISCFMRADLINEEKIRYFVDRGGKNVRIGIESGNYHIRNDIYDKDITNEEFMKAVALCKKYGIKITGFYILGGPGENEATLNDTFNFAKTLDADRSLFFIYQPLPKTKARKRLIELGGKIETNIMDGIDSCAFHVYTKDLSPKTIKSFQFRCFLYFISKRTLRLLKKHKLSIILNFIRYFIYGKKKGIPWGYTVESLLTHFE